MMKELLRLVINTYIHLYGESKYQIEEASDNNIFVTFPNERIQLDNFVGKRYRLTFSDYEGVIDDYRDTFDIVHGYTYYCCDVSNFIDLTESFIKNINSYLKSL